MIDASHMVSYEFVLQEDHDCPLMLQGRQGAGGISSHGNALARQQCDRRNAA
jgi:hypothetical protein